MKNDREFLVSMWNDISKIEFESDSDNRVKERDKKLTRKTCMFYGLTTVICGLALYGLLPVTEEATAYLISLPLLLTASIAENRLWRTAE